MKERMNVLKSEAKQICLWGEAICSESDYLMICDDGQMIFDVYGFSDDTRLDYETEYKDYEWVLKDINYLKQGDVCKVIYNSLHKSYIYVFDKITEHYIDVGDEDYENKTCALMWGIKNNRPFKDYPFDNVYKLCKKSEDK